MDTVPAYLHDEGSDPVRAGLPALMSPARLRARGHRRCCLLVVLCMVLVAAMLLAAPRPAWADGAATTGERAVADAAVDDAAGFGLNAFTRNNAGTARAVEGEDIGYRIPLAADSTLVAVNAPEAVIVYVDAAAAEAAGFDLSDEDDQVALRALVEELDRTHSRGGAVLADAPDKPWVYTSDAVFEAGAYQYRFGVEVGGRRYTSVVPAGLAEGADASAAAEAAGLDLGDGVLWCDDASLVAASAVAREAAPTVFEQLEEFFTGIDYRPFWVSLKTSVIALVFTFALGLLAAWKTMGTSSKLKGVLDSVFTIPMVLPPTVCGFLLMLFFGQSTPTGRFLISVGIDLVFTWPAAVISAIVVSFPLMYRTALGAFEGLDRSMLDAARTLGWSEARIFRRLMLPLAWPSIAAGTVLAFARAMGEFGCTLFFAGNYAGVTQTIPVAIYFEWMGGSSAEALFWVIVVIAFSFLVILFINIYTARSQRYCERGLTRAERRMLARDGASGGAAAGNADAAATGSGVDTVRLDQDALRALLSQPVPGASRGVAPADDGSARSKGGA